MFTNVHLALEARKMKRPGRASSVLPMQEREHSLLVGDGAAEEGTEASGGRQETAVQSGR